MAKSTAEIRREKLRNRSRQAVQTRGQKGLGKKTILDWSRFIGEKPSDFKPTTGKDKNLIDILPFVVTQSWYKDLRTFSGLTTNLEVGDWDYKLEIPVHPNVGEGNDTLICHRLAFGGKCIRCDEMFEEYEKEEYNQKIIDALKPKWKCWYNVYDYDEENNPDGVNQIWEDFSYHLFEKQVLEEADEGEETVLYSDIEEGKSIEFKGKEKQYKTKTGSYSYIEAQGIEFKDRDPYEESIVKETVSFDALVKICTIDEFTRIHLGLDNDEAASGNSPDGDEVKEQSELKKETAGRQRRQAKKDTPADEKTTESLPWEEGSCPKGGIFGNPTDENCEDCPEEVFDACAREQDKIKAAQKEEKVLKSDKRPTGRRKRRARK